MNYITLKEMNQKRFAYEIKEINITNKLYFNLSDPLMQNIEILIYYIKMKNAKHVVFKNKSDIDIVCFRKFLSYLKHGFLMIIKDIKITLQGFSDLELQVLLGERLYLNYCFINDIKPAWNENLYDREEIKNSKYEYLKKYESYNVLLKLQEELPFSCFNYPAEQGKDRFVFYFHMYSDYQRNKILEVIDELELSRYKDLIQLIKENKINDEIYYYALGFVYKNDKLVRLTLYTKPEPTLLARRKLGDFLKKKHKLTNIPEMKNMWYYGVDYFNDGEQEIKLYDEPHIFIEKLDESKIFNVLNKKRCVRVLRYKNNKIISTKYEFEYKYFDNNELDILEEYELYDKVSKLFAIYINENKIVKQVKYNI